MLKSFFFVYECFSVHNFWCVTPFCPVSRVYYSGFCNTIIMSYILLCFKRTDFSLGFCCIFFGFWWKCWAKGFLLFVRLLLEMTLIRKFKHIILTCYVPLWQFLQVSRKMQRYWEIKYNVLLNPLC